MKIYNKDLISSWTSLGIDDHDIVQLLALRSACEAECDDVSRECSYEGKPSHGEDYEIRCKDICAYYTEAENEIFARYEL